MKVIFRKGVHLRLYSLEKFVLHHGFRHLLLAFAQLVDVFFLFEGGFDLLGLKFLPGEVVEPGVGFELFYTAFEA